jgi:uncharacterized membrane protein
MRMPFVDEFLFPVTLFAALGCGLMGGLFFAFSNFVMKALARLPAEKGIAAMQSINLVVLNPLFLSLFLGTAGACLLLAICSVMRWSGAGSTALLIGSVLYVVGTFGVTVVCNVPRNDALARVDASKPEAVEVWREYVTSWTRWNHVRTTAALVAAASLTMALCQLRAVETWVE